MADIILADDDPGVLDSIRSCLEVAEHRVRTATHGGEVLKLARQQIPDVVVTDIIMPGVEGIETIVTLRRNYPDLKILAISGGGQFGRIGYLDAAAELGANAVLSKPFGVRQLFESLAELGIESRRPEARV